MASSQFLCEQVVGRPQPPRETIHLKAVRPERNALEIRFPRVTGFRVDFPDDQFRADFTDDSIRGNLLLFRELL